MENEKSQAGYGLKIGRRTFIATLLLLLAIMVLAGVLTRIIPQGAYTYIEQEGRQVIVPGSYTQVEGASPLPVWRWFTAPFEVLASPSALSAVMIMVFILLIGGSFMVLEKSGMLSHLMRSVIGRYGQNKYRLLAVMVFICMLLGSTMGLFEEAVTLVPITVALSLMLGWDTLTGIGMSILSVGFGFAAGTFNPFTVGVTQKLAGLPLFSGVLFRLVFFAVIYLLLTFFLVRWAKKVEADPKRSPTHQNDIALRQKYTAEMETITGNNPAQARALRIFGGALALVFLYILTAFFVPALQDYSMPVMALLFTFGSLVAGRAAGMNKGLFKTFFSGVASILPSVLLILLAMGVTFIMQQGGIIDTILHFAYTQIEHLGPFGAVLAMFLFVLVLEFFISGSTAKAFLLIPIITPLADMVGITRQTAVQAFILGDGFTNMLYPTNVVLLITLGLVGVSYGTWFRWTWKLQLALLALSCLSLLAAIGIGYGPY